MPIEARYHSSTPVVGQANAVARETRPVLRLVLGGKNQYEWNLLEHPQTAKIELDSLHASIKEIHKVKEFAKKHHLINHILNTVVTLRDYMPGSKPSIELKMDPDGAEVIYITALVTTCEDSEKAKKQYDTFVTEWLIKSKFFGNLPIVVRWI